MQKLKSLGKGKTKDKMVAEAKKAVDGSKDAQDAIAEGKAAASKLGGAATAKADEVAKEKTVLLLARPSVRAVVELKPTGLFARREWTRNK